MLEKQRGFTLVELVAVMVLVGILGTTVVVGALPSSSFQLQSSRDQLLTAFFVAQQRAMAQTNPVRLSLSAPNVIDVREDTDGDGDYSDEASAQLGGIRFPLSLLPSQTLSAINFDFDRLGKTNGATISLTQSGDTLPINVSNTGFIQ